MFDEIINSKAAEMIAGTSRPVIYYWKDDYKPWIEIIAHPTLYINLLALIYKVFGKGELVARLFGVINYFVSVLLIILISRLLFKKENKGFLIGVTAACLCLINPLLVRGSVIVDIDTTVLVSCILVFIFLAVKSFMHPAKFDVLYLSLVFALCVWAKETALVLVIPTVFFYLLLSENRKQKAMWLKWAGIFLLGFSIFYISWWVYCRLLNLPSTFPIEYTIFSKMGRYLFSGLYPRIATLRNNIFWLSPFLFLLFVMICQMRFKIFLRLKKIDAIDFLVIMGIWVLVFYTLILPTTVIPKYVFILVPLFSISVAATLFEIPISLNNRAIFFIISIFLACFIYYLKLIPDPLLVLLNKQAILPSFWENILQNKILVILIYAAPLFFSNVLFKKILNYNGINALTVSAFVLFASSCLPLVITQSLSNYATFYHYGERGLKEAIHYAKKNINKNEILFGRKEFEYYLPQRVYFDLTGNTRILKGLIDNKKISYVIFSNYYEGEKGISTWLEKTYKKVYASGNFSVYKIE